MANKRDYYEVLGISKNATEDDIKKAYRTLAKKYHPDVSQETNATEKFKEVQEAYDVLSDATKKENYDRFGHEDPMAGFSGGSGFSGFSGFGGFEDIFSNIFGGGTRRSDPSSPTRGKDLRMNMNLSFEESVFGAKKKATISRFEECTACGGSGAHSHQDIQTCSRCRGQGRIIVEQSTILGRIQTETTCPDCKGRGKKITKVCDVCNGAGRNKKTSTINIDVPAGIEDEQTIRYSGQGEAGLNGGPSGDLYININVQKHEIFERDGNDILLDLPITFSQAALGVTMEVKTIHGMVALKIPAGTQTGTKFKLTSKGVISKTTNRTGHQYVTVNVITPTRLTTEQKDLFNRLGKTDETVGNRLFDRIKKFFSNK